MVMMLMKNIKIFRLVTKWEEYLLNLLENINI